MTDLDLHDLTVILNAARIEYEREPTDELAEALADLEQAVAEMEDAR